MRSIVLGVLLVAAPLCGQNSLDEGSQLVVMVNGRLGDAQTFGAGILFARQATRLYIATANHVVRAGGQAAGGLQVRLKPYAGRGLTARLLPQADAQRDVAVLVVDDPVAQDVDICAVRLDRLGEPGAAKRGDKVFPIGNPNGVGWALPVLPDAIADVTGGQIVFQSTLIARGHSGGGLLNANGKLIGMIQADEPPYGRALGWATVAETLKGWALPVHLHVPAPEGDTPLMVDAASGDVEDAKDLLGQPCVDVNAKDEFGRTPLHFAVSNGRSAMTSLLLQAGAKVNVANDTGQTPLAVAAGGGNAVLISALIANGANVNSGGPYSNPLAIAAGRGRLNAVELLLANGARPAADGRDLFNVLNSSPMAAKVREDIVRALIRAGANVNARDETGDTALALAVKSESAECVRLLLDAGAAVDVKNRNGYSLLRLAAIMPYRSNKVTPDDIAVLLLQHGAKAEGEDRAWLLERSAKEGWADVVKLLGPQGADFKSPDGSEVLLTAVEKGQVETAKALLDAGVNPKAPPYDRLLRTAIELRDPSIRFQMVQLLVLRGAKVNVYPPDSGYGSLEPLSEAVSQQSPPDLKVVEFLIAHGARVTENMIRTAEYLKHPEAAQLLRKALASRNGPKR